MSIPAPICLLLPLLGFLGRSQDGPPAAPAPIPWSELQSRPVRHLREPRRVVVQVRAFKEDWNPYLTRFGPREYVALDAWSDEQRPWRREDWEAPAARVFVRRGTMLEAYLRTARPHQRFLLTVILREHCGGRSWAEVVEASRLAEEITVGTIVHVARGLTMLERGAREVAASELERALAGPLPEAARAEIQALRDQAR